MKELLISIPGNPSIPLFYQNLYQSILAQKPNLEIVTLYHMGQSSDVLVDKSNLNLENNFAQHKKQIEDLINKTSAEKIYLLGHSLGSCSIISHYQHYVDRADKIILTCPFHTITGSIKRLMQRLKNPVLNKAAELLLWQMLKYEWLGNNMITNYVGSKQHAQEVRSFLSSEQRYKHFLKLLSTYYDYFLLNNYEEQVISLPVDKAFCLFAEKDAWSPKEIRECFSSEISEELKGVSHAYPLDKIQSNSVGNRVASLLGGDILATGL